MAVAGWFFSSGTSAPPAAPTMPPIAQGHYVLVVEGDRTALSITHANLKADPWAGVPKGFASAWKVTVRDARGETLAEVPLDVSAFATSAAEQGQPVQVEGCIVRDSRIGILANVPAFAAAASYTFTRDGQNGVEQIVLGQVGGDRVRQLAGGGR